MAKETTMMKGGHLYIQTNEIENAIIHYQRGANGMLTEVTRVRTGGAGSGEFKPISGQESAPNAFEGASQHHSSRRIDVFCLRRMAATTRSPPSASVRRPAEAGRRQADR